MPNRVAALVSDQRSSVAFWCLRHINSTNRDLLPSKLLPPNLLSKVVHRALLRRIIFPKGLIPGAPSCRSEMNYLQKTGSFLWWFSIPGAPSPNTFIGHTLDCLLVPSENSLFAQTCYFFLSCACFCNFIEVVLGMVNIWGSVYYLHLRRGWEACYPLQVVGCLCALFIKLLDLNYSWLISQWGNRGSSASLGCPNNYLLCLQIE